MFLFGHRTMLFFFFGGDANQQGAILTTMLVSRNFNSKNLMSKKSDGSQVKESTDSSATMDEDDGKGEDYFSFQ